MHRTTSKWCERSDDTFHIQLEESFAAEVHSNGPDSVLIGWLSSVRGDELENNDHIVIFDEPNDYVDEQDGVKVAMGKEIMLPIERRGVSYNHLSEPRPANVPVYARSYYNPVMEATNYVWSVLKVDPELAQWLMLVDDFIPHVGDDDQRLQAMQDSDSEPKINGASSKTKLEEFLEDASRQIIKPLTSGRSRWDQALTDLINQHETREANEPGYWRKTMLNDLSPIRTEQKIVVKRSMI